MSHSPYGNPAHDATRPLHYSRRRGAVLTPGLILWGLLLIVGALLLMVGTGITAFATGMRIQGSPAALFTILLPYTFARVGVVLLIVGWLRR
jgi:hypothetical protein